MLFANSKLGNFSVVKYFISLKKVDANSKDISYFFLLNDVSSKFYLNNVLSII